ncbi:XRE family transcriptional regulator [Euzebyella marina]|uniref:XRE family transcriptional regulator n=1 Tax=Euzebyella marina TaxID=1761453 RepID=A0A3G2L5N3_9FLAO|nr:helix-turn-helix transcriptional regulator [Euzebyella marina]AYN67584.1 XRE family transcriptional regulator [Euzebyella marina]
METVKKNNHIGRKIGRIRELRGIKQETLAEMLGVSQQSVSKIEQSENLDTERLEAVAKALGVTPEAIHNFSEELAINYFNNFNDSSEGTFNNHCTFNPLDKVIELYERLVQAEKDKVTYLENLLDKK